MARSHAQQRAPRSTASGSLPQVNANAAGIDVGARSHFEAVPADRDAEPVREFATFTVDLYRLADWLRACGVETVAMESDGGVLAAAGAPRGAAEP